MNNENKGAESPTSDDLKAGIDAIRHTCPNCNVYFPVQAQKIKHYNYAVKNNYKYFCSSKCYTEAKITSVNVKCACCGREILRHASVIAKSKTGQFYCNRSCATIINNTKFRTGVAHPNYKYGNAIYRNKILRDACSRCGYNKIPQVLEIHHRDRNRRNNAVENLECLCPTCHKEEHFTTKTGLYTNHLIS